jgi:hypothetical protein
MPAVNLGDLLWYYSILFGWSSVIAVAAASFARTRFQAYLKASFIHSTSGSDVWEEIFTFWNLSGLGMAGFSILCCGLWLIL